MRQAASPPQPAADQLGQHRDQGQRQRQWQTRHQQAPVRGRADGGKEAHRQQFAMRRQQRLDARPAFALGHDHACQQRPHRRRNARGLPDPGHQTHQRQAGQQRQVLLRPMQPARHPTDARQQYQHPHHHQPGKQRQRHPSQAHAGAGSQQDDRRRQQRRHHQILHHQQSQAPFRLRQGQETVVHQSLGNDGRGRRIGRQRKAQRRGRRHAQRQRRRQRRAGIDDGIPERGPRERAHAPAQFARRKLQPHEKQDEHRAQRHQRRQHRHRRMEHGAQGHAAQQIAGHGRDTQLEAQAASQRQKTQRRRQPQKPSAGPVPGHHAPRMRCASASRSCSGPIR